MVNTIFIDKKRINVTIARSSRVKYAKRAIFFFYTSGEIENPKKDDLVKQEAILADEILLLMLTQYAFRRFTKVL